MKAVKNKDGNYTITKGKYLFEIINGTDRYPYLPTRIKYDGTIYPLKIGLIDTINAFKECYSEEQVLEKLLEFIQILWNNIPKAPILAELENIEDRVLEFFGVNDIESAGLLAGFLGEKFYEFWKIVTKE